MMSLKEPFETVSISLKGIVLKGHLTIPENAIGMVIFSHGSGSSRLSPRNNYVAEVLQQMGLATLLFDLLTEEEDKVYENRFNIDLLTMRLVEVTRWVHHREDTGELAVGYFGASTGAASALMAAALLGKDIKAVVSRGGRPDLALEQLHKVMAPTLLIVGARDYQVIELNKVAFENLKCERELEIVPTATHLFGEPGTLESVADISGKWFVKWLQQPKRKSDV